MKNLYKSIYKLIIFIKTLQRLKQEWQKSPAGTRQTDGKNLVWFGEIERKLAKLSKTTFTYRSSSKLFYGSTSNLFIFSVTCEFSLPANKISVEDLNPL